MRPSRSTAAALIALVSLALALAVLATLQYRWIGLMADADARRMQSNIEFASNQFVNQVDHDLLTRSFVAFGEPAASGEALFRRYQIWSEYYRGPRLIRAIYYVAPGSTDLQQLDFDRRTLVPAAWPAPLAPVRAALGSLEPSTIERIPAIIPQSLFVIVPCGMMPAPVPAHEPMPHLRRRLICPAFTVVELDRARFLQLFLPELTRHAFGRADGGDYEVAIANPGSGEVLYRSDRWPEGRDFRADFATPIFRLRVPRLPEPGFPLPYGPGEWRLIVRYRGGSMAQLVTAARQRNLAVALAVLAVLGVSAATLMIMLRRTQRLQQQQLQFVAGVTHELHTPLAAMTSAGQNLADGIISERQEVARYGGIIVKESRRLTDMIAQVLDYAGMQSRAPRTPEDVDLGAAISEAVEQCRWMIGEKPIRIDVSAAPDLPSIRGDAAALTRAMQNLVANAIRHGGTGGWVRISAVSRGRNVAVTVEDGGPGIRAADLPHLFEPFFRGEGSGRVRGSGLGLTLVRQIVEQHGGSVSVDRQRERGASFTILLPAPAAAAPAQEIAGEHA